MKATRTVSTQPVEEILDQLIELAGCAQRKSRESSSQCLNGIWLVCETGLTGVDRFRVYTTFAGNGTENSAYYFSTMKSLKAKMPKGFRLIKITLKELNGGESTRFKK